MGEDGRRREEMAEDGRRREEMAEDGRRQHILAVWCEPFKARMGAVMKRGYGPRRKECRNRC